MGAGRVNLSLQLESFANHRGQLGQDFSKVAAGLFLQQDGGNKEPKVGERHSLRHVREGDILRRAQVLFVEQPSKLEAQGSGDSFDSISGSR